MRKDSRSAWSGGNADGDDRLSGHQKEDIDGNGGSSDNSKAVIIILLVC
jgi:hypothetical protein